MKLFGWWFLRIPVLLFFPMFFIDLEIIFLISSFLFVHFMLGLKTILNDYLHNTLTKIFLLVLIRLCSFEFLRYNLEFLI